MKIGVHISFQFNDFLCIREMQTKTTMRLSTHTSQNGNHQKYLQTINARESVEKREPSCNVGGNINWYLAIMENSMKASQKN